LKPRWRCLGLNLGEAHTSCATTWCSSRTVWSNAGEESE
jgi:hypothetical protein